MHAGRLPPGCMQYDPTADRPTGASALTIGHSACDVSARPPANICTSYSQRDRTSLHLHCTSSRFHRKYDVWRGGVMGRAFDLRLKTVAGSSPGRAAAVSYLLRNWQCCVSSADNARGVDPYGTGDMSPIFV